MVGKIWLGLAVRAPSSDASFARAFCPRTATHVAKQRRGAWESSPYLSKRQGPGSRVRRNF